MNSLSDRRRRARGVTLLEMLVVLAIISFAAVFFAAFASGNAERTEGLRAAEALASAIRSARADAIASGAPVEIVIDAAGRSYSIAGATQASLPARLSLEFTGARELMTPSGDGVLRLFPDGSTSGARIRITGGAEIDEVSVDWLTGAVRLERQRRKS